VIENIEYLGKFEDFQKCWLYCVLYILVIERCKKKNLKTDYKISCMCTFKVSIYGIFPGAKPQVNSLCYIHWLPLEKSTEYVYCMFSITLEIPDVNPGHQTYEEIIERTRK
jgi:hypothetical protein